MVDFVEQLFEFVEQVKRRLAHTVEHAVGRVFGSNFQASGNMFDYQLAVVLRIRLIYPFVAVLGHRQIVANTATDKRFLTSGRASTA